MVHLPYFRYLPYFLALFLLLQQSHFPLLPPLFPQPRLLTHVRPRFPDPATFRCAFACFSKGADGRPEPREVAPQKAGRRTVRKGSASRQGNRTRHLGTLRERAGALR